MIATRISTMFKYLNLHRYFQNFSKFVNVFVGFGVILIGLILAISLPFSTISGLVASVFSICGTMIWFPALAELKNQDQADSLNKVKIDEAISNARFKWESEERQKIIDELRKTARVQLRENEDLQIQLANLKATQMTATSWRQQWEMVLLEVDHKISDWQEKRLYDADPTLLSRAESHIYRGLLDKSFTAKLGFNLDRLRVHVPDGSSTLLISIPEVSLVGVSKIRTDWRHKHVEVFLMEGSIRSGDRKIHDQHRGLQQAAEAQSKQLEARVNNGVDLEYLHDPVREMAKRILRSMLSPLHDDIQFVSELTVEGTPLPEYLDARRKDAETRLSQLRARQHEIFAKIEGDYSAPGASAYSGLQA